MQDADIRVAVAQGDKGWYLELEADRLAQSVHIALDEGRATMISSIWRPAFPGKSACSRRASPAARC